MISTGKIYLGSPFYTEEQKQRSEKAKAILAKNPTIAHIFFPFDFGFVDPKEKDPQIGEKRTMLWRHGTYQNDLINIYNATCGVFLYDMDQLDDGSAFEIGFMRALHKPVVLVPFTESPEKKKQMNLMIAQGVTALIDGNTELDKLASYDFNTCLSMPVTDYGVF